MTVKGCGTESIQGDSRFAEVLEQMGAKVDWGAHQVKLTGSTLNGIDVDMNQMPDAAMTLAVTALFASGPTAIRNIYQRFFLTFREDGTNYFTSKMFLTISTQYPKQFVFT